ncbi:MAG: VIT1/CCC1 transporter family protein [Candidatus Methanofastidiosia archaeon]
MLDFIRLNGKKFLRFLRSLKDIKTHMRITEADEIARRYLVMNGFDGILTVLGLIVGAYSVGNIDPRIIIGAGIGTVFALGISGISGSYMAEKAERKRKLLMLEKAMLKSLDNSMISEASTTIPILTALINGLSPAVGGFVVLSPFILSIFGYFPIEYAFYASIGLTMLSLFLIGVFIGRISKENVVLHGFKMALIGLATAAIILFLKDLY